MGQDAERLREQQKQFEEISDVSHWRESPCVRHWVHSLINWVGVRSEDVKIRAEMLLSFCEGAEVPPASLLEQVLGDESKLAGIIAKARTVGLDLIVQSFLIHNGVNVYGKLVCVPRTPEELAEQGTQFTS